MDVPNTYQEFLKIMMSLGYLRVERDDRILDTMPDKTREKGIELWEKQVKKETVFIQLHLPYNAKKITTFSISGHELESALQANSILSFDSKYLEKIKYLSDK